MVDRSYEVVAWVTKDGQTSVRFGMITHHLSRACSFASHASKLLTPTQGESCYITVLDMKTGMELQRTLCVKAAAAVAA